MGKIKEEILNKIKSKEITMRPRVYFTLKVAALAAIAGLVLLVTVFIFNFIFFIMRMDDRIPMMSREVSDLWLFMRFFPWGLLAIDILLVALLEYLLRKFRFIYTQPVMYVFFGMFAFIIATGLFIDRGTPFNDRMLQRADEQRLPRVMNEFYGGVHRREGMRGGGWNSF